MKRLLCLAFSLLAAGMLSAQNIDIRIEGRESLNKDTGMNLDRLSMEVKGSFNSKLSFDYFQHFNRLVPVKEMLYAADRLYLRYTPTEHWSFTAGKIVSAFGSFEYDDAPIDIYFYTRHLLSCGFFLPGIDVSYHFNGGKDSFSLQMTKGAHTEHGEWGRYSYNFMWTGHHGWMNTLYSANMHELPDGYKQYEIALGHRMNAGWFSADVDLCNRFFSERKSNNPFSSGFFMTRLSAEMGRYASAQVKASYDFDRVIGDRFQTGIAFEFFPYKGSRDLRLHLQGSYIPKEDITALGIGLKWNCHLFTKQ